MLKFKKGGSSAQSPVRTPDTLTTNDTVEVLVAIGEGPCKGPVGGPKGTYADDTPLVDSEGHPNVQSFAMQYWPGSSLGHSVVMELGGFANPINIGQVLAKDVPITRTGLTKGIDAADFRIVVQQLFTSNDKGTALADLALKFEIKKTTESTWHPAWVTEVSDDFSTPPDPDGQDAYYQSFGTGLVDEAIGKIILAQNVVVADGTPTTPPTDVTTTVISSDGATIWNWGGTAWTSQAVEAPSGSNYQTANNGRRIYFGETFPTDQRTGDIFYTRNNTMFIVWDGNTWVDGYQFADSSTPISQADGVWRTAHKVSSNTAKDFRVFLEPDANAEYQFRVTKLSADSSTTDGQELVSVVQWESIGEIKRSPMTFQNVAMARIIGKASDQFSSFPNWSFDFEGRIVKVPSNYNAVERTYSGVWDGTYKLEYTNNTAFIFQDFVENETYGLSSIYPHVVNKWQIYDWGVHNDVLVDRPDGSQRPRWTFNDFIATARDAKEMAQYIAGSAGARYVDDGNGIVNVIVDRDEDPVALFIPENVGEDGFSYSYTERLTRPNEVIVNFVNPDLNYQEDKRVITDDDDIEAYGRISEDFIAVGCNDVDEAIARARRRLIGGLTEKEMVTFTVNRKGRFLSEWDVILCADPAMGRGATGRIRSVMSPTSASLRDPLTFEASIIYWATFETPGDPFETHRVRITNSPGTTSLLTFATALPTDLPPHASFVVEAEGLLGYPKPYRVTSISDESGNGEVIRITALELNRNKWTYIDTGVDLGTINYGTLNNTPEPPTDPVIRIETRKKGIVTYKTLILSWTKSPSPTVRRYKVYAQHAGAGMPMVDTGDTEIEIEGIDEARYDFSIVAVSMIGKESKPLTISFNGSGVANLFSPTNLRLAGGGTIFNTLSPVLLWDAAQADPNLHHYEVTVGEDERVVDVGQALTWTYDIALNRTDHAGVAQRELDISVCAVDAAGNKSLPAEITITNPAPAKPAGLRWVVDGDGLVISWNPVLNQPDFGGTRIYVQTTAGVAVTPGNLKFEGPGVQARFPVITAATYHVLVGHYDLYDPTETVFSDTEFSQDIDQTVKELIDGLTGVVEDFEELQTRADEIIADNLVILEQQEVIAEDIISARLSTIEEITERERMVYLEGEPLGSVVKNTVTVQDDLVETIDLIGVKTSDGGAFILDTNTVQVGGGKSMAERFTLMEAETTKAYAYVDTKSKVAADATSAVASTVTTLSSNFDNHVSYIKNEVSTVSTAVSTETKNRTDQASSFASNLSTISNNLTTYADAQTATATELHLLGAKNSSGTAFILDNNKVMVGASETMAQRLATTEAKFNGTVSSALLSTITATASEANAALTSVNLMGAKTSDGTGFILDYNNIKVSPTETMAEKISSVQAAIPSNASIDARADTRISASITAGGPIASLITGVETTANGASAQAILAFNTANGNTAYVSVLTAVSGKITGMRLNGSEGNVSFLASTFEIVDPSGGNPIVPFYYSGGVTRLRGTVLAEKLVVGAATRRANYSSSSSQGVGTSLVEVGKHTYTALGGAVKIDIMLGLTAVSNTSVEIIVKRDGSVIDAFNSYLPGPHNHSLPYWSTYDESSGNHDYSVEVRTIGSGATDMTKFVCRIFVTESLA